MVSGEGRCTDPLAMGFCIEEDFFSTCRRCSCVWRRRAPTARGACIPEERPCVHRPPNVRVALGVNSERFLDYFRRTASE